MEEAQKILEKSTSERLSEIIPQLTTNQRRFIVAMQGCPTKKEAAEAIGLEPNTVYGWPDVVDEAIDLVTRDVIEAARQLRKSGLLKAIMVKLAGLDNDDDAFRQRIATEIIEWEMGKAELPIEHRGGVHIYLPDNQRGDGGGSGE